MAEVPAIASARGEEWNALLAFVLDAAEQEQAERVAASVDAMPEAEAERAAA